MNIFENILNPVNQFKKQPVAPTPVAPRTANYVQPIPARTTTQSIAPSKPSMTLFSDEKGMLDNIRKAGINDDKAFEMIKRRRNDLFGDKIAPDEVEMLKNMVNANIRADDAVAMLQKRREDQYKESTRIKDQHADEGVVEQTIKAPFRAVGDVATQAWQGVGKGTQGLLNASFRGVNELNRLVGSNDYDPTLGEYINKETGSSGIVGDVAKIGAGTTGTVFNLGKAPLALGFNTANQLPGAQYITQGLGKGFEYGAEKLGGLAGLDKGTSMDVATTGMNLLGMKPGMNTMQYARGIQNAQGVIGKAGAIVKPVGGATVEAVRLPYDVAKGTGKALATGAKYVAPKIAQGVKKITPNAGKIRNLADKASNDLIYEAVNPTKIENKKIVQQRAEQFKEYLKSSPDNSLESVKSRIDADLVSALDKMKKYEEGPGVKGNVDIEPIVKKLQDKYMEKVGDSYVNQDGAKMAQGMIDILNGFGKSVKDADIIKIRRAFDDVEAKNKGFMQSADANVKGEVYGQANKFFREEIHKSNPEYSKALQDYSRTKTLSDVIGASIERKVGQTGGGVLRRGLENTARVTGAGLGGLPGYIVAEALNQGVKMATSPNAKLTISKLLSKGKPNEYRTRNPNSSGGNNNGTVQPSRLMLPAPSGKATGAKNVRVNQPMEKPPLESTKKAIIKDPRKKALDDYIELKSLEESLMRGDEAMNFQARKDLAIKVNAVRKKMEDAQYARVMSGEMKKMVKETISDIKASFPEGTISIFNKLNGILKRSKKGYYNDIEGEMGATGLKKDFTDATNAFNNINGTNYSATQFFEYLQGAIGK